MRYPRKYKAIPTSKGNSKRRFTPRHLILPQLEHHSHTLCLSETTLYYFTSLANQKTVDHPGSIENWVTNVMNIRASANAPWTPSATAMSLTSSSSEVFQPDTSTHSSFLSCSCGAQTPLTSNQHAHQSGGSDDEIDGLSHSLPPGAERNNRFRRVFIPTYERWVGTQADPWVIPDDVAIPVLQTIWDAVYMADGVRWSFMANDPVFNCVNQRLCEWRASFKSAAEIMFEHFFEDCGSVSTFPRQKWFAIRFDDSEYVWGNDENGKWKFMHSPFVLLVLAAHLNGISGAMDIEGLEVRGLPDGASSTQKYPPMGALALAVAAVERAHRLCASGKMRVRTAVSIKRQPKKVKAIPKRNHTTGNISIPNSKLSADPWVIATTRHYRSIANMTPRSLDAVVNAANKFVEARYKGSSGGTGSIAEDTDNLCARRRLWAHLIDRWDAE